MNDLIIEFIEGNPKKTIPLFYNDKEEDWIKISHNVDQETLDVIKETKISEQNKHMLPKLSLLPSSRLKSSLIGIINQQISPLDFVATRLSYHGHLENEMNVRFEVPDLNVHTLCRVLEENKEHISKINYDIVMLNICSINQNFIDEYISTFDSISFTNNYVIMVEFYIEKLKNGNNRNIVYYKCIE